MSNFVADYLRQQQELGVPDYYFIPHSQIVSPLIDKHEPTTVPTEKIPQDVNLASEISVQGKRVAPLKTYEQKRAELVELYREVEQCSACLLGATRGKLVFGAGNAAAELMIVGEAPGFEEDRTGRPFVGPAGQLLDKMLSAIDVSREKQVFITNVVKCRPPGNRDPQDSEIVNCIPILHRQVAIIAPKAILCLGRLASTQLLGVSESVSRLRGSTHEYRGIPVVVTYHPAFLLREPEKKRDAWEDLKKLQKILSV